MMEENFYNGFDSRRNYDETLLQGYVQEKNLYVEVFVLAKKLRDALKGGEPIGEIVDILEKKNLAMKRIEAIEKMMEKEKKKYRDSTGKSERVAETIDELSGLIEEILAVERENEVLFTTSSLRGINDKHYSREFVVARYLSEAGGQ
ncbi:MAG: hypothetical protein B6D63_03495 [Candidatus Latescibacteria bacterium 4484_7]|nr:MAG: hypothetical protein B6D63_03495 [Candidatus Latescibacteria bacterium 4484_7]RKZ06442.1 MAG: hypothetical protein DRQ05_04760 [bacterium]